MKFSIRTTYGLKALLLLASRYGEGSLSVSVIAKKEGISVPYLEQILNALKKKGFVKSVRGPQGGYMLNRKPSEINLESLFYALAGNHWIDQKEKLDTGADLDEVKLANWIFWKKLKASLDKGLSEITLKELIDEARRLKKAKPHQPYTFHI